MTRRGFALAGITFGLAFVGASVVVSARPLMVWNATASAPVGVYRLTSKPLHVGDFAAVRPAPAWAGWLAARGYLPAGALLVKRLAAEPPSDVCRHGGDVLVDGRIVAIAQARDRAGRELPAWSGCRRLTGDDILLINNVPGSLDGRYFGPVSRKDIVGRLAPVWLAGGRS